MAIFLFLPARSAGAAPVEAAQAHWLVRDVAANGMWAESLPGLRVDAGRSGMTMHAVVSDMTGMDRAITLAYVIPFDATGWTWHDDGEHLRVIVPGSKDIYSNLIPTNCGATGSASLYPFAVLSHGTHTLVLGVPPTPARMVRLAYDPVGHELRGEFDFGLSAIPKNFPSRADAAVFTCELDSKWPFRAAIEKYWQLYPDAFARRANTPAGNWLPFGDIRTIANPTDFFLGAHECADSQLRGADAEAFLAADAAAHCQSFPYVEPPTYWQQFKGPPTAGYKQRLVQLKDEAAGGSLIAQSTLVSGIITANGERDLYLGKVAYTTQAPWGSDANPDIPLNEKGWPSKGQYETTRLLSLIHDHPSIAGVYIDSMEGWGTILDYNQEHWRVSRFPLTFDPVTKKVVAWNFWGTYSFISSLAEKLHGDHKLLMANDAYYHFWFPFPNVDIPGREYTWADKKGHFAPVPDERYLFFKSMAGRRPYLMLMNNKYDDPGIMEPYFQRSLFFAVYPSMFSGQTSAGDVAYFSNPAWYNRDRPLFKKYLPLIQQLDLAGWQPVPLAAAIPSQIRLERFGSIESHNLFFTLHNPTNQPQDVTLSFDPSLNLPPNFTATERITNHMLSPVGQVLHLTLHPEGYADIRIEPTP